MSELTSQPAVLSFPPSGGNHQGHPPITITIKNAADFAAFCETFQGLNAGNAQAPENNIDTTSPVSSKSTVKIQNRGPELEIPAVTCVRLIAQKHRY